MNETLPPQDLLDHLGLGYYLLGPNDDIIAVDSVWRNIFGMPMSDPAGKLISEFYVDPEEAHAFRDDLAQTKSTQTTITHMKRNNGEWFYAEITAKGLFDEATGAFQGQEAIIRDVTPTEVRNRIVDWLPVGFYMVQVIDRRHRIAYCNNAFAKMFGFRSPEAARGHDIADLYQNRRDFEKFLAEMNESEEDNNTRQVNVQTVQGKRFVVEATVKWDRDAKGDTNVRYGLVRDLIHDIPLQQLRANLTNVLHTYTNNQIPVHFALQEAIEALGPSPFETQHRTLADEVLFGLQPRVQALAVALKRVNDYLDSLKIMDEFVEKMFELEDALERVFPLEIAYQIHAWLDIAKRVKKHAQEAPEAYNLPKDALNSLLSNAGEIERLALLVLLIDRDADFIEIGHEVRLFSNYLNASYRPSLERKFEVVDLAKVVKQVCNDMGAFALSRRIIFVWSPWPDEAKIWANERDVVRVMSNIVHNAVKYSWERPRRGMKVREVRFMLKEVKSELHLDVENFGVPIPEDELKLVFRPGYRGRLANDRGRLGSGVGLTDARAVIDSYGGSITLESRPIGPGSRADELPPHITTVRITLPKYEGKDD